MTLLDEREVLMVLFECTNGRNWAQSSGWSTDNPLSSSWYGVTVAGGHVTKLELARNGLSGAIPPSLGKLENLTHLCLNENTLEGPIPSQLGCLAKLENLSLYTNKLFGPIPSELGNLSCLTVLNLWNSNLSGRIPAKLGQLARLAQLDLSFNDLEGPIPLELSRLTNLVELDLWCNNLSGPIPSELERLVNLRKLDLNWNYLSGSIPAKLGNDARSEPHFVAKEVILDMLIYPIPCYEDMLDCDEIKKKQSSSSPALLPVRAAKIHQGDIICLSYPWRDPEHPDRDGCTLHALREFLQSTRGQRYNWVFWDYLCIPQRGGDTSKQPFKLTEQQLLNPDELPALIQADMFYHNADTLILNAVKYTERTWCVCEMVLSILNPRSTTYIVGGRVEPPGDLFERLLFAVQLLRRSTLTYELKDTCRIHDILRVFGNQLFHIFEQEPLDMKIEYIPESELRFDPPLTGLRKGHEFKLNPSQIIIDLFKRQFSTPARDTPCIQSCPTHSIVYNTGGGTKCYLCNYFSGGLSAYDTEISEVLRTAVKELKKEEGKPNRDRLEWILFILQVHEKFSAWRTSVDS
ncbi:unnamed protein product [Chrysoparadoxa australica]